MALTDDDIGEYATPDGRIARLPHAFAQKFANLTPVQAPEPQGIPQQLNIGATGPAPSFGEVVAPQVPIADPRLPQSVTNQSMLPTADASAQPVIEDPQVTAVRVAPPQEYVAATVDNTGKAPNAKAAARTPQGPQGPHRTTDADLLKIGLGGVYDETQAGIADEKRAVELKAELEAQQQAEIAGAYHQRNEEIDARVAKRAADAEQYAQQINDKTVAMQAATDRYANTKIDRSVDHPILAGIAVALGAIGSAMKNENKNPGLDALYAAIDRKVAGQMQDLDKQGKSIGMQRDLIADMRQQAGDRLALNNLMIAGESEKAARRVEEMAARSNSDIIRANGIKLASELRQKSAAAGGEAVKGAMAYQQAAKQLAQQERDSVRSAGVQYTRIGEDKRQFNLKFGEDKRQFDLKLAQDKADKEAAIRAADAKGTKLSTEDIAKIEKENRELGVGNPSNGSQAYLTSKGQKLADEASGLEAEAKALRESDAAKDQGTKGQMARQAADMKMERASQLRGEAKLHHQFKARDTAEAKELSKTISDTQQVLTGIDIIKKLRKDHGPKWLTTGPGQQAMSTYSGVLDLSLKEAFKAGALDEGTDKKLQQLSGGDPSKLRIGDLWSVLGEANTDANLDALGDAMERRAHGAFQAIPDGPIIKFERAKDVGKESSTKAAADIKADTTPQEESEGSQGGGKVREFIDDHDIGAVIKNPADARREAADNSGSTKYVGLTENGERAVRVLYKNYNTGTPDEKRNARAQLLELAGDKREGVSRGVLYGMQDEAPDLYREALKKASPAVREHFTSGPVNAAYNRVVENEDSIGLAKLTVAGDESSRIELVKRAAAGDKTSATLLDWAIGQKAKSRR